MRYEQENNSVYMIAETEICDSLKDYEIKMIENNVMKYILPVKIRCVNNKSLYYYDVTSRQQFSKLYEYSRLTRQNVDDLILSLDGLVNEVNEYMLDLSHVCMDADYIFADASKKNFLFAYGIDDVFSENDEHNHFKQGVKNLFDYIIEHFDHSVNDSEIIYIYGVYQKIIQGDYEISGFKALLEDGWSQTSKDIKNENAVCEDTDNENILEFVPKQIVPDDEESENRRAEVIVMLIKAVLGCMLALSVGRMLAPAYVPIPVSDTAAFVIILVSACMFAFIEKIPQYMFIRVREKESLQPFTYNNAEQLKEDVIKKELTEEGFSENAIHQGYDGSTILLSEYIKRTGNNAEVKLICQMDDGTVEKEGFEDIEITEVPWVIGSDEKYCNSVIKNRLISHIHVCITKDLDSYYIEDMNSTNGTYVNGERLIMNSRHKLSQGDVIKLAVISYKVEISRFL